MHTARNLRYRRPLRTGLLAAVVIPDIYTRPAPTFSGKGLAITICLAAFAAALLLIPRRRRLRGVEWATTLDLAILGGAGVALAALQPGAASEIPASAAVFIAAMDFPPLQAAVIAAPVTAALGIVIARQSSSQPVVGTLLLCGVLYWVGQLSRQSDVSRERTERLLVELEAARDEQAQAAAAAERTAIARELHDVLAHALSGLSIQLEGARQLARNDAASPELRGVIDRSATLAKEGLVEARRAVSALRDDPLTLVENLPVLVDHYRRDLELPVELVVTGTARPIPAEVSQALYRTAGEALTNVVRHAPGAATTVRVKWDEDEVSLKVMNHAPGQGGAPTSAGSGWGLVGMAERVSRVGGRCFTGPVEGGWAVEVEVPT
jgi:signal transduction histidine kinase